ncbi:MAG: histidine kinase dimerization/phospho-acceptor domain-containing protein, partial [Chloroflexota bacterium]
MTVGLEKDADINRIKDLEAEVLSLKSQLDESRRLERFRLTSEEELRELSLNLSLAQNDAENRLQESQILLNGLQHLYKAADDKELFSGILSILGQVLELEEACLIMGDRDQGFLTFESSFKLGFPNEWKALDYFIKVIEKNRPAALFDVKKSPAMSFLAENPLIDIKSLLLIPLPENSSRYFNQPLGLLICTHSTKGFFGKKHISLGSRFGLLAAQAVYNHLLLSELNQEKAKLEERVIERTREIETLARFPDENPNGVIRFDTKRYIQYSNTEGHRFLKRISNDGERLSTNWEPIISKALKDRSLQEIQIKQEDCVFICHLSPIISESYFNLYTQDITEKFEAQKAQLRSDRRLSIIFENAQDGIIETDEFGTILVWNKQAELIFGWRSSEVIGLPFIDLVVANSERFHQHEWSDLSDFNSMEPFINKRLEIDGKHRNKSIFPIEISVTPVVIEDETIFSVFLRDVTENKKVLDELNKARIEAESAVKAKSRFLANMSHEIRTPLNSIIGMSQLLAKTSLNQQQSGFFKIIEQNGDTLLTLVNDLLNFSKLESNSVELETTEFNINELVEQSIDVVSSEAAKRQIELQTAISPNIPHTLYGDFGKIKQIMVKLLSHAVKFTQEETVTLDVSGRKIVSATDWLREKNQARMSLEFVIKNAGIGIDKEKLIDLFSPFNQVDPDITRIYGGTGLGLSICKELVDLMKGTIDIDSAVDQGTAFSVKVPLVASNENLFGLNQNQFLYLAEKNILIVTPNEYDKVLLTQQLILMDMIPHALDSLAEGLHLIKNGIRLDAVILGVNY